MELVATSKLSKAKERIAKSRYFHSAVYAALTDIAKRNMDTDSVYALKREIKKSCFVIIGGDRGLAGGYNSNVFRYAKEQIGDKTVSILPIGKRTTEYCRRMGYEIVSDEFSNVEEQNVGSCHEMANLLTDCYLKREFDELYVVYTEFISVLNQRPEIMKLLPLDKNMKEDHITENKGLILFEPGMESVFNAIVPSYVAGMLWGAVCESTTSEFGARRTAMESATKNAEEMIDNLSLKYNRARQGSITQEITEIVAGSGL
jgi:F-type H+-transporting ATPase subunit gamma